MKEIFEKMRNYDIEMKFLTDRWSDDVGSVELRKGSFAMNYAFNYRELIVGLDTILNDNIDLFMVSWKRLSCL